jgi:hypothetical protein
VRNGERLTAKQGSIAVDLDDGVSKGLRGFLRKIVPDAALDSAVRVFAREPPGIGPGVRVWRAIGITFKSDGGHLDGWTLGKPLFYLGISRLAFSQAEPPAITMDHDADVIRVVEGRCTTIERGIIEIPLRRSELPNELRKIVPVFFIAGASAFGGKIILVRPTGTQPWAATGVLALPAIGYRAKRINLLRSSLMPGRLSFSATPASGPSISSPWGSIGSDCKHRRTGGALRPA